MKKINIFNKEVSYAQLAVLIAIVVFIIGAIIAVVEFSLQADKQKKAEEPIFAAANECVVICDKIYAEMEKTDDETFLAHKANVEKAETAMDKYYAALTMMDYTDEIFNRRYRDQKAAEYEKQDPNNYSSNLYQQSLNELQNEYFKAKGNLEKAREEYTVIK